jgi:hypothetical protein
VLRQWLVPVAFLFCCSVSYSSTEYGITGNAARDNALQWVMSNILPQQAGLQVNSVFYRYTTVKNPEDDMLVHVQNENAQGTGYIFRETDDWSGVNGNTITKSVPVPLIPIDFWGNGSIEVEGQGSVVDTEVVYGYQFDPCFDPQSNPTCPDYVDPMAVVNEAIDVIDPLDEDYVQAELDRKANMRSQDEEEDRRERRKIAEGVEEDDTRLEVLLGMAIESEFSAEQLVLHNNLMALKGIPTSYTYTINGGTYNDAVTLKDAKLPKNSKGLRVSLAQDIKHQQIVNLQYAK